MVISHLMIYDDDADGDGIRNEMSELHHLVQFFMTHTMLILLL